MDNSTLYMHIDLLTEKMSKSFDDRIMVIYSIDQAAELKEFYLETIKGSRHVEPCPFCGETDIRLNSNGNRVWYACTNCDARSALCRYEQSALDAWNKRVKKGE